MASCPAAYDYVTSELIELTLALSFHWTMQQTRNRRTELAVAVHNCMKEPQATPENE